MSGFPGRFLTIICTPKPNMSLKDNVHQQEPVANSLFKWISTSRRNKEGKEDFALVATSAWSHCLLQTGVAWHWIKERTQSPCESYDTRACSSTPFAHPCKGCTSLLHHAHPLWNTKACDIHHLAQRPLPSKFTRALKNTKSKMILVWQVARHVLEPADYMPNYSIHDAFFNLKNISKPERHVGRSAWWIETIEIKHPQLQIKLDWFLALHLASHKSQYQNMTKHFLHSSPQLLLASTPWLFLLLTALL